MNLSQPWAFSRPPTPFTFIKSSADERRSSVRRYDIREISTGFVKFSLNATLGNKSRPHSTLIAKFDASCHDTLHITASA